MITTDHPLAIFRSIFHIHQGRNEKQQQSKRYTLRGQTVRQANGACHNKNTCFAAILYKFHMFMWDLWWCLVHIPTLYFLFCIC